MVFSLKATGFKNNKKDLFFAFLDLCSKVSWVGKILIFAVSNYRINLSGIPLLLSPSKFALDCYLQSLKIL